MLSNETKSDRKAEAKIGEADIARARAWVAGWDFVVRYLDGDTVKRISAKELRDLWTAKAQ
jgi:hypothetical protein